MNIIAVIYKELIEYRQTVISYYVSSEHKFSLWIAGIMWLNIRVTGNEYYYLGLVSFCHNDIHC